MEQKDMIKSLLRELITDDVLNECIKAEVARQVDETFEYEFNRRIAKRIDEVIRDKADSYIISAVEQAISGKVRTDDGWGNSKTYGSFEDLVRARIGSKLNDGWNVERKVRDAVDARIKKLCDQVRKEHVDNMAEQVIERLKGEA